MTAEGIFVSVLSLIGAAAAFHGIRADYRSGKYSGSRKTIKWAFGLGPAPERPIDLRYDKGERVATRFFVYLFSAAAVFFAFVVFMILFH